MTRDLPGIATLGQGRAVRDELWAGMRVRVTGGVDREGGGAGPVVVLLHGFGAPGDDLVGVWRTLRVARETRFVFPEAPIALAGAGPGARAWWHIDPAVFEARARGAVPDRSAEEPPGMTEAHAKIAALLDDLPARLGVDRGRIALGGFSQGAMLACDVALRDAHPLAALVLLSATLLAQEAWAAGMPARRTLPVFQSHGRRDPLLSFDAAVRLRDLWRAAGATVEWHDFPGVHEIPLGVVEPLGVFLDHHLPALPGRSA